MNGCYGSREPIHCQVKQTLVNGGYADVISGRSGRGAGIRCDTSGWPVLVVADIGYQASLSNTFLFSGQLAPRTDGQVSTPNSRYLRSTP